MAKTLEGVLKYDDAKVVDIRAALQAPQTVTLDLKGSALEARGAAFYDWQIAARKKAAAIAELAAYKDAGVVTIEEVLDPPATVKLEIEYRHLVARGAALSDWIAGARKVARAIPGIAAYRDDNLIDIQLKLAPPESISLVLKGRELYAQGSASQQWIQTARKIIQTIPEISILHEDILILSDPAKELELVIGRIEDQYLLFDSSESQIASGQEDRLKRLVGNLFSLFDLAQVLEKRVMIEITGHTDTSGSYRNNRKLSKERAENVKNFLVSQGLNRSHFKVRVADPQNRLQQELDEHKKKLNRRVSFKVSMFYTLEPK